MFSNNITSLEESYVEVIEGDYPKDNTNEILIPKTLASTAKEDVVGKTVNYNGKEYTVSGVYDDLKYINQALRDPVSFEYYSTKVQNKIYFSYTDKKIPTSKDLEDFYKENQIQFTNSGINSYEQYLSNYQDGIVEVIVNYNPQKDAEVYESINALNLTQDSRYTMYLQHQEDFQKIKEKKMVSMIVFFVVFLVFFSLIYKYRFAFRQEEFNILFDSGLLPREVKKLLIIEAFIDTILVVFILLVALKLVRVLSNITGGEGLLIYPQDLVVIVIFVLISLIIINIRNLNVSLKKRGK